jgi:hypothetical protein
LTVASLEIHLVNERIIREIANGITLIRCWCGVWWHCVENKLICGHQTMIGWPLATLSEPLWGVMS